jgi:hypothetical protein
MWKTLAPTYCVVVKKMTQKNQYLVLTKNARPEIIRGTKKQNHKNTHSRFKSQMSS